MSLWKKKLLRMQRLLKENLKRKERFLTKWQMYKVILSKNVINTYNNFLLYQARNCIYYDTWIINEAEIVKNYIEKNESFIEELNKYIFSTLKDWLWWKVIDKKKFKFAKIVFIRSYIITVSYTKIEKDKLILVDSILITT